MPDATHRLPQRCIALASLLSCGAAQADNSVWVGLTSDSVWRGMSQSSNETAPFVYLLAEADSGYYAGVYVSKQDTGLGNSASIDYYIGRLLELDRVSVDLGYVYYRFPGQTHDDYDLGEAYLIGSSGGFSAGVYHSVNSETADNAPYGRGDTYSYVSYETMLSERGSLLLTGGYYGFDEDETLWGDNDFAQMQVDLTIGPLTFSVSKAGSGAGETKPLFFVTWTQQFR